jgi:hypothetical protein
VTYTPIVRAPSGIPAAPLIMVTGAPKTGKSVTAYKLGLSPRIDNCWVIDLGEGSADEYAQLGGYHVLEWGQTWADLTDSIRWCVAQPVAEGHMNAVIVDSGTEVWEGLKDRASKRARGSKKNRQTLANDPDAEVDVSMNYWNDAANTWGAIVGPLKTAPHVVGVILVRADIVAEVINGAPTNKRVTSLQAHKSLPATATVHVEVRDDHSAWLRDIRSLSVDVPRNGRQLDPANPLGEVLDLMAPDDGRFGESKAALPVDDERPRDLDQPETGEPARQTKPSAAQTAKAMAMFTDAGIMDRDDRLKATAAYIGREVGSWNDLTRDEASVVIDALTRDTAPQNEPAHAN